MITLDLNNKQIYIYIHIVLWLRLHVINLNRKQDNVMACHSIPWCSIPQIQPTKAPTSHRTNASHPHKPGSRPGENQAAKHDTNGAHIIIRIVVGALHQWKGARSAKWLTSAKKPAKKKDLEYKGASLTWNGMSEHTWILYIYIHPNFSIYIRSSVGEASTPSHGSKSPTVLDMTSVTNPFMSSELKTTHCRWLDVIKCKNWCIWVDLNVQYHSTSWKY